MSSCLPAIHIHFFCITSHSTDRNSEFRIPVFKYRLLMIVFLFCFCWPFFSFQSHPEFLFSCFRMFDSPYLPHHHTTPPIPIPIPPLSLVPRGSLFPIPYSYIPFASSSKSPLLPGPPCPLPSPIIIPDRLSHLTSLPIFTLGAGRWVRRRGEAKCQMPNVMRLLTIFVLCRYRLSVPTPRLLIIPLHYSVLCCVCSFDK